MRKTHGGLSIVDDVDLCTGQYCLQRTPFPPLTLESHWWSATELRLRGRTSQYINIQIRPLVLVDISRLSWSYLVIPYTILGPVN